MTKLAGAWHKCPRKRGSGRRKAVVGARRAGPCYNSITMAEQDPKSLLREASTPEARQRAVAAALDLGMPLSQIEEYLDWLDAMGHPAKPGDHTSARCPAEGHEPRGA